MRVAFVGAGALGRIYGTRLAAQGDEVAFVVRPERAGESAPFVIEQVNGAKRRDVIERPRRVVEVPEDADVVLVTVRFDQLTEDALIDLLKKAPDRSVVLLTPSMPAQTKALAQATGRDIYAAMPGVSGYIDERDVVRYWTTGVASTLIEAPEPSAAPARGAALEQLARRLTGADFPARIERDVASLNAATTTAFFPLIAAIDAGSGIDGVLSDKALLSTALEAAKECDALARRIGKVAPWAHLLTKFVGPFTLKPGVGLARRLFPESVRFVEHHFGPKLHEQHLAMGASILALGREQGVELPALDRLMRLLESRPNR